MGLSKKETAWKYFSKYIRVRDALETTGTITHARCITCGKIQPITAMDTGHAISGRNNGILFSEELCYAQCVNCNRFSSGTEKTYKDILTSKYGQEKWEKLAALKRARVKYTDADYEEIAANYRKKTKELKQNAE